MSVNKEMQMTTKRKKRKRLVLLGVTVAVMVFGCAGCFLIGALTPDALVISRPMRVSTPEEIVEPAPLPTPAPTITPAPTSTPVSTYRSDLGLLLSEMVEHMDRMTELTTRAADDPLIILDTQWRREFRGTAENIQFLSGVGMLALPVPPPEFCPAHSKLVQAMRHYNAAAGLMISWLDTNDLATLQKIEPELSLGTVLLTEATTLLPD